MRIIRAFKLSIIGLLIILISTMARCTGANATIISMDCMQVQSLVQQYGKARAVAWALEQMALGTYS